MFDLEWSKLALIAVVALVVIGPKDLPRVLRMVGQWVQRARSIAREFQGSLEQMMRESELEEVKRNLIELRVSTSSANRSGDRPRWRAPTLAEGAGLDQPVVDIPTAVEGPTQQRIRVDKPVRPCPHRSSRGRRRRNGQAGGTSIRAEAQRT